MLLNGVFHQIIIVFFTGKRSQTFIFFICIYKIMAVVLYF